MNKIRLTIILTLFSVLCGTAYGQVTIGSVIEPNKGALLDLKQEKKDDGGVTASQGMMLPRVNLVNLKPTKTKGDNSLPVSIGADAADEDWSLKAHIGLTVYNVKAPDQCASEQIPVGIYTWTGTEWEYLGRSAGDELAPGVHEFTDPRDGEKYLYGNFGNTAGDWMLENLRYIPKAGDGYPDYSESAATAVTPYTAKYYAFPGLNGTYNSATAKTDWESGWKKTGVLYNWPAALNVEDLNSSPLTIANPGNINQGDGRPDDNTDSPVRGVCPENWHVPSDKEWNQLEKYIYEHAEDYSSYTPAQQQSFLNGGSWDDNWSIWSYGSFRPSGYPAEAHGKAMKSPCKILATLDLTDGLSNTAKKHGFSALLAGRYRDTDETLFGLYAYFWSSSAYDASNGLGRYLNNERAGVYKLLNARSGLFSVRCKRDDKLQGGH